MIFSPLDDIPAAPLINVSSRGDERGDSIEKSASSARR